MQKVGKSCGSNNATAASKGRNLAKKNGYSVILILTIVALSLTACRLDLREPPTSFVFSQQAQTGDNSPQVPAGGDQSPNVAPASAGKNPLPIIDTHVHYNQAAWAVFSPREIIDKLIRANVSHAVVSSTPDHGTRMLAAADPGRIIPFLRPYHDYANSSNWSRHPEMLSYLNSRLETPIYSGIGEFHMHEPDTADSAVVQETIKLAMQHDLYLHIHSNAATIRNIFTHQPGARILWAHAGLTESPQVVSEMLDTYDKLWTDISIREHQIAPDGVLDPAWEALFLRHPDRITIGSDTWVTPRWHTYEQIIDFDRAWLNQLPLEVAEQIAYKNAQRLWVGP